MSFWQCRDSLLLPAHVWTGMYAARTASSTPRPLRALAARKSRTFGTCRMWLYIQGAPRITVLALCSEHLQGVVGGVFALSKMLWAACISDSSLNTGCAGCTGAQLPEIKSVSAQTVRRSMAQSALYGHINQLSHPYSQSVTMRQLVSVMRQLVRVKQHVIRDVNF